MTTTEQEIYKAWEAEYDQKLAAARSRGWEGNRTPDDVADFAGGLLEPHSQEEVIAFVEDLHCLPLSRELENLFSMLSKLAKYYGTLDDPDAEVLRAAAQATEVLLSDELRDLLRKIARS